MTRALHPPIASEGQVIALVHQMMALHGPAETLRRLEKVNTNAPQKQWITTSAYAQLHNKNQRWASSRCPELQARGLARREGENGNWEIDWQRADEFLFGDDGEVGL